MQIIQLTNMTYKQTMGYVFRAKTGEVLVVDGGHQGNHRELERVLTRCGGHVDLWLLTHPHADHYTAIIDLMKCGSDVTWDKFGAGVLPEGWGKDSEDGDYGEIVYDTGRPERENLLILCNSYGCSVRELVGCHFNKTYVVDLREYMTQTGKSMKIHEYIEEHDIDKVLILGDVSYFLYGKKLH